MLQVARGNKVGNREWSLRLVNVVWSKVSYYLIILLIILITLRVEERAGKKGKVGKVVRVTSTRQS